MHTATRVKPPRMLALAALLLPLGMAACTQANQHPIASTGTPQGVYQAAGNTPEWHLTLAQHTLTFKQSGAAEVVRTVTAARSEGTQYTYVAPDLTLHITAKPCTDPVSGQAFTQTVRVDMNSHPFKGCGGDPVGPASLNNTKWRVTAINGTPVAIGQRAPDTTTQDMAPTLDINASGKVSGSDGCNRYVGGLEFGPNGALKPSKQGGISTLMACIGPNAGLSQQFNAVKQAATHWHMQGETLVLETADNRTLTLRPVL